jgi:hypothetical protein
MQRLCRSYSFAKTPLKAAHAPLAIASTSHAGFDLITDIKPGKSVQKEYGLEELRGWYSRTMNVDIVFHGGAAYCSARSQSSWMVAGRTPPYRQRQATIEKRAVEETQSTARMSESSSGSPSA